MTRAPGSKLAIWIRPESFTLDARAHSSSPPASLESSHSNDLVLQRPDVFDPHACGKPPAPRRAAERTRVGFLRRALPHGWGVRTRVGEFERGRASSKRGERTVDADQERWVPSQVPEQFRLVPKVRLELTLPCGKRILSRESASPDEQPSTISAPADAPGDAEKHEGPPLAHPLGQEIDPVEAALSDALALAAKAGQWTTVELLSRELSARRLARTAPEVTTLEGRRDRAKREGR
jgi:hypothetical protein